MFLSFFFFAFSFSSFFSSSSAFSPSSPFSFSSLFGFSSSQFCIFSSNSSTFFNIDSKNLEGSRNSICKSLDNLFAIDVFPILGGPTIKTTGDFLFASKYKSLSLSQLSKIILSFDLNFSKKSKSNFSSFK